MAGRDQPGAFGAGAKADRPSQTGGPRQTGFLRAAPLPGLDDTGPDAPGPDVPGPDVPVPDVPCPDVPVDLLTDPDVPDPEAPGSSALGSRTAWPFIGWRVWPVSLPDRSGKSVWPLATPLST